LSSASTDGVFICHSIDEVRSAARNVLASSDIFGTTNREALVQSYLDGTEYIVDTVSWDGETYVCGVWRYEKRLIGGGKRIYDKDILVSPDAQEVAELSRYVEDVLAALNIRYGAAHAEVMLTADGPALVEIGARLNGNMHPEFHDGCLGANQADVMALACVHPKRFEEQFARRVYDKRHEAIVFNVATTFDGMVRAIDQAALDRIRKLPSVFLANVKVRPGQRIRTTIDLLSSPVRVFMRANSYDQILEDYDAIERFREDLFVLE
jgi:biotin carboxylase